MSIRRETMSAAVRPVSSAPFLRTLNVFPSPPSPPVSSPRPEARKLGSGWAGVAGAAAGAGRELKAGKRQRAGGLGTGEAAEELGRCLELGRLAGLCRSSWMPGFLNECAEVSAHGWEQKQEVGASEPEASTTTMCQGPLKNYVGPSKPLRATATHLNVSRKLQTCTHMHLHHHGT